MRDFKEIANLEPSKRVSKSYELLHELPLLAYGPYLKSRFEIKWDEHHIIPSSRYSEFGIKKKTEDQDIEKNRVYVPRFLHSAYHYLFHNFTAEEVWLAIQMGFWQINSKNQDVAKTLFLGNTNPGAMKNILFNKWSIRNYNAALHNQVLRKLTYQYGNNILKDIK